MAFLGLPWSLLGNDCQCIVGILQCHLAQAPPVMCLDCKFQSCLAVQSCTSHLELVSL